MSSELAVIEKTYVFDNQEVRQTGRTASKTVTNRYKSQTSTLYEIQPIDPEITWKKFVNQSDLYEIN